MMEVERSDSGDYWPTSNRNASRDFIGKLLYYPGYSDGRMDRRVPSQATDNNQYRGYVLAAPYSTSCAVSYAMGGVRKFILPCIGLAALLGGCDKPPAPQS